ncbi:unnamed protein product [Paramecium octaurelia]|uniref:Protein kinase domain-containing protein n=1 Tax=Paramecium octaurelia TaxID=43137 RepID=A0A8S1UD93_PAROT|nr:unnamed protein product [Paramecium octaurelia]
MAELKPATVLEPGYAITREQIKTLRTQDGNMYLLGYINYGSDNPQPCAVKINNLHQEEARISAQREREVLMRVNHKNIARTYKIIEKDNKMYIFKEYDVQITLQIMIQRLMRASQNVDEMNILNLGAQLIHCLNYMETLSLTNRDLNPSNVLFSSDNIYKIFDFGSSRIIDENQILQSMAVGGNEFFMSPQMLGIDDSTEIDYYKSDIWSLGMILYYFGENQFPWRKEIQQGDPDFEAEIEKMSRQKLPFQKIKTEQLRNLIRKMLEFNQEKRASAKELLEEKIIKDQLKVLYPQEAKLEFVTELIQRQEEMNTKQPLDETFKELIFNILIRYFTENKNFINQGSQVYKAYHSLLDYQMFNKKQLWQNFKIKYCTKMFIKNFVNEYKRQSELSTRQQQELLLLLQTIDSQKAFPNDPQQLIELAEKQYLTD